MAPVTTTGRTAPTSSSRANADSSMVSVPCVTTTPAAPAAKRWSIAVANAARSFKVRSPEGTWPNGLVSTSANCRNWGTAATRSFASNWGVTPSAFWPAPTLVDAIVPPREKMVTLGSCAGEVTETLPLDRAPLKSRAFLLLPAPSAGRRRNASRVAMARSRMRRLSSAEWKPSRLGFEVLDDAQVQWSCLLLNGNPLVELQRWLLAHSP